MADSSASDKLSIYPKPNSELALIETKTQLEQNIAFARHTTLAAYKNIRGSVQSIVERWINVEHAVERRLKSFKATDEQLTPGVLYVGVATLTGSILARNRTILLRFALPPTLFLISMNQFLPKTSYNISSYISSLERAHAPTLADAHEQVNESIASGSVAARRTLHNVQFATTKGLEHTLSELQNWTGLRLIEIFGWARQTSHKAEDEVKGIVGEMQHKLEKSDK